MLTERHRVITSTLGGLAVVGAVLAGAGSVSAEPADPAPAPVSTSPVAPPPPPVPSADAAAPPAAPVVTPPHVPEIPNPQYGSGQSGSGVLGTLKDLWHQVQNPTYEDELMGGGAPKPPPGAGPAPALPPGYVSINAPGSETASSSTGGAGPATGRPALPPGYYSTSGPPPPGYQYGAPAPASAGSISAAPTTLTPVPSS